MIPQRPYVDPGDQLRERGLRSTPQRRAILAAFHNARDEHLSADELYARVHESLPDLSRGTVYATLAEFTEIGLLASVGVADPVRYETNTETHSHFRCRLCLRLFDVDFAPQEREPFERDGHLVERLEMRAEGICHDCSRYADGLEEGAMATRDPRAQPFPSPLAIEEISSPLGPLMIGATTAGVTRIAFAEEASAAAMQAVAASRPGRSAQAHTREAAGVLKEYFNGAPHTPRCEIDWEHVAHGSALQTSTAIPYGTRRSYNALETDLSPGPLGFAFGSNPLPLFLPCHRVMLGAKVPASYVGGPERREWLLAHERVHTVAVGREQKRG